MTKRHTTKRRRPPPVAARARRAAAQLARLVRIMDTLRHGCPWDRAQTHGSLRPHFIEETYEAIDAIDRHAWNALVGELGDVLFQCVFHAQIAAENGRFEMADSIAAINTKLIRRHPHVFSPGGRVLSAAQRGHSRIRTPAAVKEQWEQIKAREQAGGKTKPRVLSGVPRSLPALLRAYEVGRRVAVVGFDWSRAVEVVDKINEEVRELREALGESPARAAEELGDLLFSLANLARKLGIEPESALRAANNKFTDRFDALETELERRGRSVHQSNLNEMEEVWETIKTRPRPKGKRQREVKSERAEGS
jgi:ATP diphosphatase